MEMDTMTSCELIHAIHEAQRLLDERHGQCDHNTKLRCPICGNGDLFWVEAYAQHEYDKGGMSPSDGGGPETWAVESDCTCQKCHHNGPVLDFVESGQEA